MKMSCVNINESKKWDQIVRSFKNYDVYYLSGYVKAFQLHGDGEPVLLYYDTEDLKGICVVMKREAFCDSHKIKYFDITTPYGYGGFLLEGDINKEKLSKLNKKYKKFLKQENIITEFVRYHPLLNNADILRNFTEIVDLGNTVNMCLSSPETIWDNLSSKNRNVIRKAEKNGIEIYNSKEPDLFEDFIKIYNETMDKNNASDYYYFNKSFYESIYNDLYDNFQFFYAKYNNKIIAMTIVLYANNRMHYHLSGYLKEYRHLAPSNLLFYKAACWGFEQGFQSFHLGGGLGSEEDNLYRFKKAFNRKETADNKFSIGKRIINYEIYNSIVNKRMKEDPSFDKKSSFFPLYRT